MDKSSENKNKLISICGMKIDMVQIPEVVQIMEDWIIQKRSGNYIVVSNAYDVMMSKNNPEVKKAVNNSSLSVPDGISLVLLARIYDYYLRKRVYGPDLMLEFLKIANCKGYSNFFYGSTKEVLDLLIKNLKIKFPSLNIIRAYSPPFRKLTPDEDREIVDMINKASPDVLWVSLGCPKQQLWMYAHKDKLNVPVMVGVGAAFDFLSRIKPQAPRWVRDTGFEWLFRLVTEPKRLWRRYLINESQFLFYAGREVILNLFKNSKKPDVKIWK